MPKSKKQKTTAFAAASSSSSSADNSDLSRQEAYDELHDLGERIGKLTGLPVPTLDAADGLKLGFLDRVLTEATQKLNKKGFGARFRGAHSAQDELWSTASTRYFVDGLFDGRSKTDIPASQWDSWIEIVDLISRLRIPTKFSGFATKDGVMQHPTEVGAGVFYAEAAVHGPHGSYDSARVKYVGAAVKRAREADASVFEQFLTAARAAIEFSLNYFTAPITAANVLPFAAMKDVEHTDPVLQDQLAARERIKEIYVGLGGKLRDHPVEETQEQAWARYWQLDLPITPENPHPVAPPSPARRTNKRERPAEPVAENDVAENVAEDDAGVSSVAQGESTEEEPVGDDQHVEFHTPSAPQWSDDPFVSNDVQAGASSSEVLQDDSIGQEGTGNAFDMQSGASQNMTASELESLLPPVPTEAPGEIGLNWPAVPQDPLGGELETESAGAEAGGGDLLLLA